jgi:hypothetical protein
MIKVFRHYNNKSGPYNFTSGPLVNVHELIGLGYASNKFIYIGEMEEGTNDIRKGRGVTVSVNGILRIGEYTNDGADGHERNMDIINGGFYEGGIMNDRKHGEGTTYHGIYHEGGNIGAWKNGKMNGKFYELKYIFPQYESIYYEGNKKSSRNVDLNTEN